MAPLEVGDHVRVCPHKSHPSRPDLHDLIGVVTAADTSGFHVRFAFDPDVPFGPGELEVTVA